MKIMTTILLTLLVVFIGSIFLQIFLSKKETRWFGLILPIITFVYSLLMVSNIVVSESMKAGEIFILIIPTFLVSNIPTFILMGIYFGYREKMKLRSQLEKMNIQDLE